jgi:tetratricopeptide (TPR) repeat protein
MARRPRTPVLHAIYQRYVADQDCARFSNAVARRYTIATLERLVGAGDRMTRRAAVLGLSLMADYGSNVILGRALHDVDRGVRMLAENGIQQVWHRIGAPRDRKRLRKIVELIGAKRLSDVVEVASKFIDEAPWFPESWNQRAIALFRLGRYEHSIRDCKAALEMNPYHFAAAAGLGQCYLKLNNRPAALECFRRALEINPNLEGIRAQVLYLQRAIKRQ